MPDLARLVSILIERLSLFNIAIGRLEGCGFMVAVSMGIHAIKAGCDLISGSQQEKGRDEVALFDGTVDLIKGNHSVIVGLNAKNFDRLDDGTRLSLRELAIMQEDEVVDDIREAWSNWEMNFGGWVVWRNGRSLFKYGEKLKMQICEDRRSAILKYYVLNKPI